MKRLSFTDIFMTASLGAVMTYGLGFVLLQPFSPLAALLAACAFTLWMALMFAFPKFALSFSVLTALGALVVWLSGAYKHIVLYAQRYIDWMFNWTPDRHFADLSAWLMAFCIVVPLFLLVHYRAPALLVLVTGVLIFYGEEYMGIPYPFWLFCIFLVLVLLLMSINSAHFARRRGLFMLCAAPLCALLLIISLMLPSNYAGMGQDYFDEVIARLSGGEDSLLADAAVEMVEPGSLLGGPMQRSEAIMFLLDAKTPMYLRGGTAAVYTGTRWEADERRVSSIPQSGGFYSVPVAVEEVPLTLCRLWMYSEHGYVPDTDEMLGYERAEIMIERLSTKRIYTLPRLYQLSYSSPGQRNYLYPMPDGSFRMDYPFEHGQSVYQDYFELKLDPETLESYYRSSRPGFTDELFALLYGFVTDEYSLSVYESLLEAARAERNFAHENYLGLPDSLPGRVRGLAASVTEQAQTDYDRARAIERYLSENFRYNLNMPETPAGEDFADYFLFEQGDGYCTYFATAMAVLCRSIGLPARYVEGFSPSSEMDADGHYIVRAKNAHAWTEVYFEGVGWLPFEPTAADTSRPGPDTSPTPGTASPTPQNSPSPTPSQEPAPTPPQSPQTGVTDGKGQGLGGFVAFIIFAALLLLAFAVMRIFFYARRRGLDKKPGSGVYTSGLALQMYAGAARLLRLSGLRPRKDETLREFAGRVDSSAEIPFMADFVREFEKVCFSRKALTAEEGENMRAAMLSMRAQSRQLLGPIRYFLYKYILGVI